MSSSNRFVPYDNVLSLLTHPIYLRGGITNGLASQSGCSTFHDPFSSTHFGDIRFYHHVEVPDLKWKPKSVQDLGVKGMEREKFFLFPLWRLLCSRKSVMISWVVALVEFHYQLRETTLRASFCFVFFSGRLIYFRFWWHPQKWSKLYTWNKSTCDMSALSPYKSVLEVVQEGKFSEADICVKISIPHWKLAKKMEGEDGINELHDMVTRKASSKTKGTDSKGKC